MEKITMSDWPAGLAWRNHFRRSLLEELEAPVKDAWGPGEREVLGASLAQFQLGESSDGRHLLTYARQFGERTGDSWLAEATALFIQEENRHSFWLGEFLKAQGFPLMRAHWVDGVFRVLRKLLGYGLMVAVLVCAEIVAVPYYTAVRKMSSSRWLGDICSRLLRDEAIHLRFQAGNLGAVWRHSKPLQIFRGFHKGLMALVCATVWLNHGAVLRRGGYSPLTFLMHCLELLNEVHVQASAVQSREWALTARMGKMFN